MALILGPNISAEDIAGGKIYTRYEKRDEILEQKTIIWRVLAYRKGRSESFPAPAGPKHSLRTPNCEGENIRPCKVPTYRKSEVRELRGGGGEGQNESLHLQCVP